MKYGFIGCGNMGGAIAKALSKQTKDILLSDPTAAEALAMKLGCQVGSNEDIIRNCSRIFLAVKPQVLKAVLEPLAPILAENKPLLITMAAGTEISIVGIANPSEVIAEINSLCK